MKGRRIRVPRAPAIRPTADRVREALFSILGGTLQDQRVLDLCSGTGALGLEALSRGARRVVFVESDRRVARGLQATLDEIDVERACELRTLDAVAALRDRTIAGPFDLILADPPYGDGLADRLLAILARGGWLTEQGRLVIERPSTEPPFEDPGGRLRLQRSARYGDSRLDFYRCPDPA